MSYRHRGGAGGGPRTPRRGGRGGPNRGGGRGRGGGGPPRGLSGREIGMFYAKKSRAKKEEREKNSVFKCLLLWNPAMNATRVALGQNSVLIMSGVLIIRELGVLIIREVS